MMAAIDAFQPVRVERVSGRRDLRRFLDVPHRLYVDDPHWIAPLRFERLNHLDPTKNPFFDRAEVAYTKAKF